MICPGCNYNLAKESTGKYGKGFWEYCDSCLEKRKPLEKIWWLTKRTEEKPIDLEF